MADKKTTAPVPVTTTRLVKSEDLNHHGTLFAGRTAEWFVEAGFLAAAVLAEPQGIVCAKIHGMQFTRPVHPGQIVKFTSKVVFAGKTSLVAYIQVATQGGDGYFVDGFITFVNVGEHSRPVAHHIEIRPESEADILLYNKAKGLAG